MSESHFLISLSDSDLFNWISAINYTMKFNAHVCESDRITIAIQGPKSEILLSRIFGKEIEKLKYFRFESYIFNKENVLVSKTGF